MKYSLATGIQRLSMPLLDVRINDIKLTFLIDTGATHNVIASFVYEQIKHCFTLLEETNKIMGGRWHLSRNPLCFNNIGS